MVEVADVVGKIVDRELVISMELTVAVDVVVVIVRSWIHCTKPCTTCSYYMEKSGKL